MKAEIVIELPRQILVLTEQELLQCMAAKPDIWANAIKRGKQEARLRASMDRVPKASGVKGKRL